MAHKKGQGASRNGRDSNGQRRGIKCYAGELVQSGNIILRQCGTKFVPGRGTRLARNCDIYSVAEGFVKFQGKKVHVLPKGDPLLTAIPGKAKAAPAAKPATS
ncbi:MAG: 50S ribosomal protein L27 [Planctomycetes bacterium]|nr:50S ribosomal protein L27 [Planctomycetota bacterium]